VTILYGDGVELVGTLGTAGTAALLVGLPLLVVLLVMVAVLGPQWSRAGRWRPGQPWLDEPMWFGRPGGQVPDGVVAIAAGSQTESTEPTVGGVHGQW
jgi:hypothetical protein